MGACCHLLVGLGKFLLSRMQVFHSDFAPAPSLLSCTSVKKKKKKVSIGLIPFSSKNKELRWTGSLLKIQQRDADSKVPLYPWLTFNLFKSSLLKIEYFCVSLDPLNIKEIWDYIWHHQAYYIKIYEQLHQKPLSLSCMETDLFWHERYMAGCSLRLMRRPRRFLLDVILWNNTCQLLPDPRRGGRFSRSSCHLSAKAHLSLYITTWSVLTGLTGRPASLAQWEPEKEPACGHHLRCWDLIITEVMKMCTQIGTLLNKFIEQALLPLPPSLLFPFTPTLRQVYLLISTKALTGKPMASPPTSSSHTPGAPQHTHSTKHAHQRSNLRRKNKSVNLGENVLAFHFYSPGSFLPTFLVIKF